jgi:hypothetical protein
MQADLERESGRQLSGIATEELQAKERQRERLGAQAFQAEQGTLERETQKELTYAGLSLDERKMFESARQFDDRLQFDAWAKERDLDEKTADRIWQTVENEKSREHDVKLIAENLVRSLTEKDYDAAIAERTQVRNSKAEYYHSLGLSGEEMDPAELDKLKKNDPLAYNSYMAGKSGKSIEDVKRGFEREDRYLGAFLTSFDPKSPAFQTAITRLFSGWGVDTIEPEEGDESLYQQATGKIDYTKITKGDPAYQEILNSKDTMRGVGQVRNIRSTTPGRKGRWALSNMEKAYKGGTPVVYNGKVYMVESQSVLNKNQRNHTNYVLKEVGGDTTLTIRADGSLK